MKSLLATVTALVLALAALLAGPSAGAQQPPRARAAVKLLTCDTAGRAALFQGAMSSSRAHTVAMRFTLQARVLGARRWARVGARGFETWLDSDPGNNEFRYDKGVNNLATGFAYRVVVRYRYRLADGRIFLRDKRTSRACRQPDLRPDLRVTEVRPARRNGDGSRRYVVTVENTGGADAPASQLGLDVNGRRYPFGIPALAAGDVREEVLNAPDCTSAAPVVATADADDAVPEIDESDNAVTVPCAA